MINKDLKPRIAAISHDKESKLPMLAFIGISCIQGYILACWAFGC